jgi:bacteriocin biosynthesis cyclodehydratase domain-containing protein
MDGSTRPLLKPWYRLVVGANRVTMRFGGSLVEFNGEAASKLLPELLPRLDGGRTIDEIVADLGVSVRPAVDNALALMDERGLLTEAAPEALHESGQRTAELLAATDRQLRSPRELADIVAAAHVTIVGAGPAADAVGRLLRLAGVSTVTRCEWTKPLAAGASLAVAAPQGDEVARLDAWNERMLEWGTAWIQVLPYDGALAAVGPLFLPGETACHRCYRIRRAAHLPRGGEPLCAGSYPSSPALDAVQAGLAATIAICRVVGGGGLDAGVLTAVEPIPELTLTRHVVHRVPRCPACSPAGRTAVLSPWHQESTVAA